MKKFVLLLLFVGVFGWLFAASASWNYDTQTGNIGTTYSWIDASGGTELSMGDDASDTVTWPFDFSVYDDNYTGGTDQISVCSNGFMRFDGAASTSYSDASGYDLTASATSLGQIIGVGIQDDNVGDSNSHVYWNVTGTSPNRVLTIEYQDLEINYNANHYADIEVQFYEADKKIVMLFGDDDVTTTSADQGIHSGVANYFYKWGDVDTNTNQTWLELTVPSNPGPGSPSNPNPADGAVNVAIDNDPDISWDNPTGASYNYVYFGTDQTLVDNMDSSVEVLGDGSTLYTSYNQASDLNNDTTYYWKVVEYDSSGNSTEGPVWSFTTLMAPQSVPYSTDFSSTDGWTQQAVGCTSRWGVSSSNQAGGTSPEMKATYENADPATARLISPPINTTGYDSLQLIFKHFYDAYGSGITIKIQTSTDLSTWTDESWVYVDPSSNIGPETVTTSITHNMNDTTYVAWVLDGNLYQFDYWYVDDVTIQDFPSCPAPTDQTENNITVSSADLDWTENGTATSWEIEYGPTGFTQGSGTSVTASSHPYTLSGLSANTTYDWYVRADCGGGTLSSWTGPSTFTTLCNAQSTFPYTYGFEDQTTGDGTNCPASDGSVDLVSCWYNVSGEGSDWKPNSGGTASSSTGPSAAQEGSIYMYCESSNSCGPQFDLYAPTFDFTSLTTPYIEFYYHMYGSSVGTLSVYGSTDGGTTWDTLWTKSGDQGDAWYKATATTSYGGQSSVLIRWNYANPTGYTGDVAIDNVTVEEAPTCLDPTDQTVSNITVSSADLDWTENGTATQWEIEYGTTGFAQGSGTTVTASSHPYTLSGLSANTTYDWYVRADCGGGTYSNWLGPNTFTTKCNSVTTYPWTEEFTNWPPDCWDLDDGSDTFIQYSNNPVYCARANYWGQSNGTTDIMITPTFDVSSLDVPILTFDWSHKYDDSYPDDALSVDVSDDNGATWTQVWYKTGADLDSQDGAGNTSPGSFVTSGTINLSSFGSNILIRFYGTSGYGPDLFIDNVTVKEMPTVTSNDDVLFSEVCDNMSGQAENTGFIELFNKKDYMINLSGDMIKMGDPGSYSDYTFTFPADTYISPYGYIVIANGANLTDFNSAWSKSLTSDQFFTDSGLAITSGKAYEYDNGSKAQIDTTPAVASNDRVVRNKDKTWDNTTTPNNGTPGETSGGDEPLATVLVSFMANFQAHELTLTWAVSSQANISQWNLYRNDTDNFANASKIASIDVEGDDLGMQEYSYTDNFEYVDNQTYYYWIESIDYSGTSELLGNTSITINDNNDHNAPSVITYGIRNYPNPFNPSTKIQFTVKESGKATLYIYNVKGQLVKKADQGYIYADKVNSYVWNGTNMNNQPVASGMYFYQLVTPKKTYKKKMMLLK